MLLKLEKQVLSLVGINGGFSGKYRGYTLGHYPREKNIYFKKILYKCSCSFIHNTQT